MLHHDQLKICEDWTIPMWMRWLHHQILDLDTTIAYDEAEQVEDIGVQTVPWTGGNTESLGLDKLFGVIEGNSGSGQTHGAQGKNDAPGGSQDLLVDEESAGNTQGESQDPLADEESAEGTQGESQDPLVKSHLGTQIKIFH